jgi:hypothetical protein
MSIAFGIALELLLLLVTTLAGKESGIKPFVRDLLQKISWSVFVCVGLAIGTTVTKALRGLVMGVLGLLAAPLAFTVAKAVHKSVAQALSIDTTAPPFDALTFAILKGLEFGLLGVFVGYWACKTNRPFRNHLLVGTVLGTIYCVMMTYRLSQAPNMQLPKLLGTGLNELIYPIGCALILYAADRVGSQLQNPAQIENKLNLISSSD